MSRIIGPQWVNRRQRSEGRPSSQAQRLHRKPPTPAAIDGLVLWLDAESLDLSDADPVSLWPDLSDEQNDVSQGTVADQPTFKTNIVNGRPVVRFDGSSDILSVATPIVTTFPFEVMGVYEGGSGSSCVWGIVDRSVDNTYSYMGSRDDGGTQRAVMTARDSSFAPDNITGGGDISGTFRLVDGRFLASNDRRLRVDGTEVATDTADRDGSANWSHTDIGAFLRDGSSFTDGLDGDIAEIIVYSRDLSATERTQVEDYLRLKYALF